MTIGSATGPVLSRANTTLRIIDGGDDSAQWDLFVASDSRSTFCHQAGWKKIMSDVLGHESHYLAAVDDAGEWRGVLPLVRVRSVLGHYLISLPFLNDGGPLGKHAAQEMLVENAVAKAKSSGARLLELRARHDIPGPVTPSNRKISVHLPLPSSIGELWKSTLRTKLRTKIRRPEKEGMMFRHGSAELDGFYEVFARNMRDLGTPVLPHAFFQGLRSTFGPQVLFAAVYTKSGTPVAGACCLHWRDEMEVTWGSSLREFNHLSPNMLLYCRLMEEAITRNVHVFNFGRCTPGGGTHEFKRQWGGHDVLLPWPSWSREVVTGLPSVDRPIYRLATSMWRHLPVVVANRIGPMLARFLP
jgi:serine/alanine adding enzyme